MAKGKGTWVGSFYVLGLVLVWSALCYEDWGEALFYSSEGLGSLAGVAGYSLFSYSLFLSSRWKKIENWFGGLDQIYHLHRQVGIWGFTLIALHPLLFASTHPYFIWYFLPFHGRTSVNLGICAFWLMVVLLGITLLKLLPYHLWKMTHKGMSIVFLLMSLHIFLSNRLSGPYPQAELLLSIPLVIGCASIAYKQLFGSFHEKYTYQVARSKKASPNTVEIFLEPKGEKISFIPGQYAFFSFENPHLSKESHPFTLCANPSQQEQSILVKARGDFTRELFHHVKVGSLVSIEGPHGRFDFTQGGDSQIWIAGGIGIAPFFSWADCLKDHPKKVDLFYFVHDEQDFIYPEKFERLGNQFRFFPVCTAQKGHLKAEDIEAYAGGLKGRSIFMCGPKRMTADLRKQFIALGVNGRNIFFEDFEFL